jgi:anti-sigma-K factor RskA
MNETMRCEEVEELAGAYALYALPPDELAEVEAHLADCERHPELAELLMAASTIAITTPEMEPPPELKTRLIAAIQAETAPPVAAPEPATSDGLIGWLRRALSGPRLGYGLAAAMAVLVIAVFFATMSGDGGDENTLVREFSQGEVSGTVTYVPDEQTAVMEVEGLDPAPEGQTYQVWAITDGQPASIGFIEVPEDGPASSEMSGIQLEDGQTVAVTLEPAGGSLQPTTEPLFGVEI